MSGPSKKKKDQTIDKTEVLQTILEDNPIIPKRTTNEYTISEKLIAINFLEASKHEFNGAMIPKYREMGQLLAIPDSTLRHWFEHRSEIEKLGSAQLESIPQAIALGLSQQALRLVNHLGSMDLSDWSPRDWGYVFSQVVSKMRLLTGASTENVAHKHVVIDGYVPKHE